MLAYAAFEAGIRLDTNWLPPDVRARLARRASRAGGTMGIHLCPVREIAERFQVPRTKSVKQSPQLVAWFTEYGEARSLRHFRESFRKVLLELS